jgi:hypothetical protein
VVTHRFDLRAVSDGSGPSSRKGGAAAADLLAVPKKAQQQASKLRYRDGKVVTTKGEKVIVEKVGEDWDGGSRCVVCVETQGQRQALRTDTGSQQLVCVAALRDSVCAERQVKEGG